MRTFGTLRYLSVETTKGTLEHDATDRTVRALLTRYPRGCWLVKAEPQVMVRVKRTFGRYWQPQNGVVSLGHSIEVARDLEWFTERYPLEMDEETAAALRAGADGHRAREARIATLIMPGYQPPALVSSNVEARPYQQVAVDMLRLSGGLLLADELGLGKTTTALLNTLHEDALPAVVVAPAHLAGRKEGRWVEEITAHFPHLRWHVARTGKPYDLTDKHGYQPDVLILTYSKLDGWADFLGTWAKYVIFEEVHELRRGQETNKGQAAARLSADVPYRIGLTATPVYNYAGEVWEEMNILTPGVLGTREEFVKEWGQTAWGDHVKVADPAALSSYLREQGVMLARTRKEVGRELPLTVKVTHTVSTDPSALNAIQGDATALARLILAATTDRMTKFQSASQLDMLMRQATGIAKAPYVAEFVRMLLQTERKVVLFGWHRAVYDIWLDRLAEFHPVLYTGSESSNQKGEALAAFKEGNARVLIMSLRSGSGVDGLQKHTNVVVFGELDWSPQVHEQGIGRIRRDDLAEPPVAYFLVAEDGSDPAIAEVLQIKRQQGEPFTSPDGKLLNNSVADVNRTRALAEAIIARSSAPPPDAPTPVLANVAPTSPARRPADWYERIEVASPSWNEGHADARAGRLPARLDDPSYSDGYETGEAETALSTGEVA